MDSHGGSPSLASARLNKKPPPIYFEDNGRSSRPIRVPIRLSFRTVYVLMICDV